MEKIMENLLEKIKKQRAKMMTTAKLHGLTSEQTLQQSRQLDKLVMEYQKLDLALEIKTKESELFVAFKVVYDLVNLKNKYVSNLMSQHK